MKILKSQLRQIIKEELENQNYSYFQNKGSVSFPEPLDINVNMMPFVVGDPNSLPKYLHGYLPMIEKTNFEKGSIAYITVHESFVKKGTTQRRPGIHTDGTNGELTKDFVSESAWGGGAWGGGRGYIEAEAEERKEEKKAAQAAKAKNKKAKKPTKQPPKQTGGWGGGLGGSWGGLKESSAGIYIASTDGNTKIYDTLAMQNQVDKHGGVLKESLQNSKVYQAQPNQMYWITDRTPHEALPATKDGYRQFIRLVSEDVSVWFEKHNTPNPLGIKPNCTIVNIDKFKEGK